MGVQTVRNLAVSKNITRHIGIAFAATLIVSASGCLTTAVGQRGNWNHVITVPADAQRLFQIVDESERREREDGHRAKLPEDLDIRYAYELWRHPSGYAWVRRDEIIPVRTISHWYLIDTNGYLKAQMISDQEPQWADP